MPRRIGELTETGIIAEMRAEIRRLWRAVGSNQGPVGEYDEFTLASSSDSAHTLTYMPGLSLIPIACLNGLPGRYGTDYTVDFTTGIVTWSATKIAGDILSVFYQTTGDLVALSGTADLGAATLRGQAGATGTGVTSITLTLDNAVQVGDTVVVVGFFNAGPGAPTISGLGATWANIHPSNMFIFVGTSVTAGLTTITVSYPFAENFTAVAAAISNLGSYVGVASNAVGPTTIDVPGILNGSIVGNPTARQSVVATWTLNTSVTGGATASFSDSNGAYTQVTSQAGNTWLAELGFATIPASGATHHTGTRSDSASGQGWALLFNAP